jgi:hypothetical protein
MKTRIKFAFGAALLTPLLLFGTVAAHGADDPVSNVPTGTQTAQTTTTSTNDDSQQAEQENEQEIEKTAADKASLQSRLDKRKAELKIKLTALEQARLKTKCKASQGNISSLRGRIKGIETSRDNVYTQLVKRLNDLSGKLKDKGLDTTQLNTEITELQTKIDTFNTDLDAYKQAVTDLAAMDCAADPTAFKASLEAARTLQTKVKDDVVAIRTYVNDTIKTTLKDIRAQLEKQDTETESEGSN